MKRYAIAVFMLAFAVFSAKADAVIGVTSGFDEAAYTNGMSFVGGAIGDSAEDFWYWSLPDTDSYENSSTIVSNSTAIAEDHLPDAFTNETSAASGLCLNVDTEPTTNLVRNILFNNTTNITDDGIWMDMNVRFTVPNGKATPGDLDKILVWVGDSTSGISGVSGTNLIITAGYRDGNDTLSTVHYVVQQNVISADNLDDWHRLTIGGFLDDGRPVFEVYVDDARVVGRRAGSAETAYRFPSMIEPEDDDQNGGNLSSVSFSGKGLLDNFAVQDFKPDLRIFYYFQIDSGEQYLTFNEAFAAAANNVTITLLNDYTGSIFVYGSKTNTLDLAGHSITNAPYDNTVSAVGGSKLTVIGSGKLVQDGTGGYALVANSAVVCIGDGTATAPVLEGAFAVREPFTLNVYTNDTYTADSSPASTNTVFDLKGATNIEASAWAYLDAGYWQLAQTTEDEVVLTVTLSETSAVYSESINFPKISEIVLSRGSTTNTLNASDYTCEWSPSEISETGGVYVATVTLSKALDSYVATATFTVYTNETQLASASAALISSGAVAPNSESLTDEQNAFYSSLFSAVSTSSSGTRLLAASSGGSTQYELNENGTNELKKVAAIAIKQVLEAVQNMQDGETVSENVQIDSEPGFYWSLDQGEDIDSMEHPAGEHPTPGTAKANVEVIKGSGGARFYKVIFSHKPIEASSAEE